MEMLREFGKALWKAPWSAQLGVVIIVYSLINIFAIRFRLPAEREALFSPPVGFLSGILTGLTGSSHGVGGTASGQAIFRLSSWKSD